MASGTAFPDDPIDRVPACVDVAPLTAEALQAFLGEEGPALARKFLAWTGARRISEADAWDAMQQVVTVVQQRLAKGTGTAADLRPARLFLHAKRHAVRNHQRSRSVLSPEPAAERAGHMWLHVEDLQGAMLSALTEALAQLSQDDREALTLYYWEANTQSQAAERLGISQGEYCKRLGGARQGLRDAILAALLRGGFDHSELPR